MDFSPRQLAFMEHELAQLIEADDRDGEDKPLASSILEEVKAEIERRENRLLQGKESPARKIRAERYIEQA